MKTKVFSTLPPDPSLPLASQVNPHALQPAFLASLQELYFRQSMVKDILTCPQMALYSHVLKAEQEAPFFAAILGSAGHHVLYDFHHDPKFTFDAPYIEVLSRFETYAAEELQKLTRLPNLAAKHQEFYTQVAEHTNDYMEMLVEYTLHPQSRLFHATAQEQMFVYIVNPFDESPLLGVNANINPFIFVGTIDQLGYYDDGTFAVRDFKFRDAAFKPSQTELDLDIQLTVYSAAIRFGKPACDECKPRYESTNAHPQLVYNGPCPTCTAKIGTSAWPQRYMDRCEIVWMRDFSKYKKNGRAGTKEYKKGDYKGRCFYRTYRAPSMLEVLMADVIKVCNAFRNGDFHRNPGKHCAMWCKHVDLCRQNKQLAADDINVSAAEYEMPDL